MTSETEFWEDRSPDLLLVLYRINGVISTISCATGIYLVLYKAPIRFGFYRYFLLNIVIMSYMFDIYTSAFFSPLVLFPVLFTCTLGPLRYLGESLGGVFAYDMFILLYSSVNLSVIMAIAYRYACLHNYTRKLTSKRGLITIAVLQFSLGVPIVVLRRFAIGNKEENDRAVIKHYPNVAKVLASNPCTGVSLEHNNIIVWAFLTATFASFAFAVPFAITLISKCYKDLEIMQCKMSSQTRRLHLQLLRALCYQFLVPLTTLILPFMMLSILSAFSTFSVGRYTSYIVVLGTTHSLGNTLMMALTIRPFTRYLLSKFGKRNFIPTELYSISKTNNENSKLFTSKATTTVMR